MQTLTISRTGGRSNYTLSPTRNTGELQDKLAKCNGKSRKSAIRDTRTKGNFPKFEAGMSTADYVKMFEAWGTPCKPVEWEQLNEEPCTLYSGADTCETLPAEFESWEDYDAAQCSAAPESTQSAANDDAAPTVPDPEPAAPSAAVAPDPAPIVPYPGFCPTRAAVYRAHLKTYEHSRMIDPDFSGMLRRPRSPGFMEDFMAPAVRAHRDAIAQSVRKYRAKSRAAAIEAAAIVSDFYRDFAACNGGAKPGADIVRARAEHLRGTAAGFADLPNPERGLPYAEAARMLETAAEPERIADVMRGRVAHTGDALRAAADELDDRSGRVPGDRAADYRRAAAILRQDAENAPATVPGFASRGARAVQMAAARSAARNFEDPNHAPIADPVPSKSEPDPVPSNSRADAAPARYTLTVEVGRMRRTLSAVKHAPFSDAEMAAHASQWAIDNQTNPHRVAIAQACNGEPFSRRESNATVNAPECPVPPDTQPDSVPLPGELVTTFRALRVGVAFKFDSYGPVWVRARGGFRPGCGGQLHSCAPSVRVIRCSTQDARSDAEITAGARHTASLPSESDNAAPVAKPRVERERRADYLPDDDETIPAPLDGLDVAELDGLAEFERAGGEVKPTAPAYRDDAPSAAPDPCLRILPGDLRACVPARFAPVYLLQA